MSDGRRFLDPDTLAKLANMNLVARLVVEGFISGLHRSPYKGFSVEFAQHREYSPGDDLKHLDWRVYARTDKNYVKQYEEETNLKAYILLDSSGSMGYRSSGLSKFEYGCYLAASLTYLMIRQQDSVGLVIFDKVIRNLIPPKSTPTHLKVILEHLEKVRVGELTNVSKVFHDLAETIRRRGLIIIISDLFDDPSSVLSGLKHFRHRRHEVIVFHILDQEEVNFPFNKMAIFRDLETNDKIQVDPKSIRQEYLDQMADFLAAYKQGCYESNIDYMSVNTSVPLDLCLTSYLTRRQKLG